MEIEILKFINTHLHGINFFNHFFKIISIISDNGYIWIALAFVLLIFKKTRKAGVLTLCGVAATFVCNSLILKLIFNRARPFTEAVELSNFIKSIGMELPDSNSFPSGHAFSSFCCAIILCLQLKKKWPFIYILAFIVALSRVFLCVHYPTDVLAGAIIGTIVGVAVYFIGNFLLNKLDSFISNKRKCKQNNSNLQLDNKTDQSNTNEPNIEE